MNIFIGFLLLLVVIGIAFFKIAAKQKSKTTKNSLQQEFVDHFASALFAHFRNDPFEFLRGQKDVDQRLGDLTGADLRQAQKEVLMLLLFIFNYSCFACEVPFRVDGVKLRVCNKLSESGFLKADEINNFVQEELKKGQVYLATLENSRKPGPMWHFTREVEKFIFGHLNAGEPFGDMPLQLDPIVDIHITDGLLRLIEGNKTSIGEFVSKASSR